MIQPQSGFGLAPSGSDSDAQTTTRPQGPPGCRGTARRPTLGRADARMSDRRADFEAAKLASFSP